MHFFRKLNFVDFGDLSDTQGIYMFCKIMIQGCFVVVVNLVVLSMLLNMLQCKTGNALDFGDTGLAIKSNTVSE